MKLVCKPFKINRFTNKIGVTSGKLYQLITSDGDLYKIINDNNEECYYNKNWFYWLEEIREETLNTLLDE